MKLLKAIEPSVVFPAILIGSKRGYLSTVLSYYARLVARDDAVSDASTTPAAAPVNVETSHTIEAHSVRSMKTVPAVGLNADART